LFLKKNANCGELNKDKIGQEVVLNGWVQKRRDLGGLIFLDLRDRTGLIQVTVNPEELPEAEKVRNEYVIAIRGEVTSRPEGAINPDMPTGEIEIQTLELEILNPSQASPLPVEDNIDTREEVRLRYRYVDLRRPEMAKKMVLRHQVAKAIRDFLDREGFLEIETPVLTRSTPEGARDYLVPSRKSKGHFFALPQSPQLFKQLLMVSGLERYFQLARCFRDEDLRGDRQPEFTQLDMEMSFVNEEDIFSVVEGMMAEIYQRLGEEIKIPFPRITYRQAMDRFGTDKPDLSFGLELEDVSDSFSETDFKVFSSIIASGGRIKALNFPGGAGLSRKEIDRLEKVAKDNGAKGLVWLALKEESFQSPVKKFIREDEVVSLTTKLQADYGDLILAVADEEKKASQALGSVRAFIGREYNLRQPGNFFLWVTEFPFMEYSEEENRFVAAHHPFTQPLKEDIKLVDVDPERVRARAYDLVLNGVELASGSIRIHSRDLQEKVFEMLKIPLEEAEEKFGFLLEAFQYGTPPHGGIAFGFDRMVMMLTGDNTIREVIAFPKTLRGVCPLTRAPGLVDLKQLQELHLRLDD